MISPALSLFLSSAIEGPYIMHNVELYPFVRANNAMFTNLNQSDWNSQEGSVLSCINTNEGIKTNLKIVRKSTDYGVNMCLNSSANLPIVSNTMNVVIRITENQAKSLFEVPKKLKFVLREVPGNTTNVITKHTNT